MYIPLKYLLKLAMSAHNDTSPITELQFNPGADESILQKAATVLDERYPNVKSIEDRHLADYEDIRYADIPLKMYTVWTRSHVYVLTFEQYSFNYAGAPRNPPE